MKRKVTRERLLEVTLRLMSEKGYLGTTTREIAREAGITEITLFRYFNSKERLFEELLQRYSFLPRLKEMLPELRDVSYEDALRLIGIQFLDTLKERESMVKIMLSEINVYPDKIRDVYNRLIGALVNTLAGYFRYLQRKGMLRSFSPETGARAFLGMLFSYFQAEAVVKNRNLGRKEMERKVSEFVDIFIGGTVKR